MTTDATKRKLSLPAKIMIGMILGMIAGYLVGPKIEVIGFVGTIFMRLLRMCIYPLVLISIIAGVSNVADMQRLRKVGIGFLLYTAITSTIAAILAVIVMNIMQPGKGVVLSDAGAESSGQLASVSDSFIKWIPDNPFSAMSSGNLIQIIIFSLVFGVMLASLRETETGKAVFRVIEGLNEIVQKMVGWVIGLAPYGVFSLMAVMIGTTGFEVMGGLAKLLVAYYIGIIAFMVIVLPLVLKFVGRVSPLRHFRNIYPVMVMAFTTCSSVGTLPVTMKSAKERCGVPSDIVGLLSAPAATMNMNGAAIEYPCFVLFASFIYNVHFSLPELAFMVVLCVIMSCGAAGVPGGGIMMCAICLNVMGLPETIVPLIAGIYTLFDLGSTLLNVTGDTVGMVTISSRLKELDEDVFYGRKTLPDVSGRF